jgi:hypothetical protein
MKRIANLYLIPLTIAVIVVVTATAYAHDGCSVATLRGNYVLYYLGNLTDPNTGAVTPFDGVGVITFDGAGNVSGTFTLAANGTITTDNPYTATYTVNADCTGVLNGTNGNDSANIVIVDGGGKEVEAIDTSSGTSAIFTLKKRFGSEDSERSGSGNAE